MTLWEASAGAGSWQDLWTHEERSQRWSGFSVRTCDSAGGPMLEQSVPEGLHPMDRTHTGAVHEELQLFGRTYVGEIHDDFFAFFYQ